MSFFALAALINGLTATIFGSLIYFKNNKKPSNIMFGWMSLAVSVWSYSYFLWQISNNQASALFWIKILSIGSIYIPIFYFHWVLILLYLDKKYIKTLYLAYATGIFLTVFSFSPYFINNIGPLLMFKFWPRAGVLYTVYIAFYILLVAYGLAKLFRDLKHYNGHKKSQILYVIWGSIIGFTGGATNFFLWYDFPLPPFGNILVSLYTIILAYATVVHRFMDVKLVMRRSSVFLATLISVMIPAFVIKYGINSLFGSYSNWFDIIILVLALSIFTPLKNYFYRFANKYLFSSLYDAKKVIEDVSDQLSSTLEVQALYGKVSNTLQNIFHSKSIGILTYSEKQKEYTLEYNVGINAGRQKKFKDDAKMQKDFTGKSAPIIVEELKNNAYKKYKKTIDLLTAFGVETLMPLDVKGKPIGLLVLGAKESGDMYNEDDLDVLKVVGSQMAIALENALLYEETRNFNRKLKQEIEIATIDLVSANEKLKKLDAAKSEFISIASHQLRTPLTAIKGYISMLIEGDFGDLNPAEKESLEKVFDSNERLIKLVENLLNVSRIESGRLQFNFEEVQMEKMVESVMDELSNYADRKGLNLEYRKPETPLPKVNIDDQKVRQVVMNLIDNAIKYTPKGTVAIELKQTDKNIEFSVSDSGMGISPTDLPNLFQKFSRGTGTSLVHTEGTGLGLFVARQMMEAHHGTIWAESKGEGLGSKFCFKLPIIQYNSNPQINSNSSNN